MWYEGVIVGGVILGAASLCALHVRRLIRGGTRCGCGRNRCTLTQASAEKLLRSLHVKIRSGEAEGARSPGRSGKGSGLKAVPDPDRGRNRPECA